ncbi:MAG: glycosyltransferase family 4 protein [Candidatus Eisenbacteria bacterium]|uniref:Glycosyltransferase family 4 protein n=1 Tax=Eiseniibacteriota bacterium TaxID=2212470 RepID=A0A7Y2E9Y8_UNCEI|nr:glycosyltransferase family 4 protein [Candidatus Eisenbacteria bacterium]
MGEAIRVLHLRSSNFVGGPEKQLLSHVDHVDRTRYAITLGSFLEGSQDNAFLSKASEGGIPTLGIRQKFVLDVSTLGPLRKALSEFDVVLTHDYKATILTILAKRPKHLGHGAYVRGWTAEQRRVHIYNALEKIFLRRADLVVTVADKKIAELIELGIPKDRIRVIPNATLPAVMETPSRSLREEFEIPSNLPLFLTAGRFSSEKGQDVLMDALGCLKTPVAVVLFGDGPTLTQIKNRGQGLAPHKIFFGGFRKSWHHHLPEATGLINPSRSEVMPNVVLEAMAHETPVVATSVGGVPEIIDHEHTGILAPSENPEALANAIQYLLDLNDVDSLRSAAKERVATHHTFEVQAKRMEALYEELMGGA